MAMRRAVAATRQAISPRLAMSIFLNMISVPGGSLLDLESGHYARIGFAAEDARQPTEQRLEKAPALSDEPHAERQHGQQQYAEDEGVRHRQPQAGRHHAVFDQRGADVAEGLG